MLFQHLDGNSITLLPKLKECNAIPLLPSTTGWRYSKKIDKKLTEIYAIGPFPTAMPMITAVRVKLT